MSTKRAIAAATAILIATGTSVAVSNTAQASPLTSSFAEEVEYAAHDADVAFIAGDWDGVRSSLAWFDASMERLQDDLTRAQATHAATLATQADADRAVEEAEAALAAVQPLLDALTGAQADADAAAATVDTRTAQYDSAVAIRDAVPVSIWTCIPAPIVPGQPSVPSCYEMPNPERSGVEAMAASAFAMLQSATFALTSANAALASAQQAWANAGGDALVAAVEAARSDAGDAADDVANTQREIDWVQGFLDQIAPSIKSAEDRRADLADLETVKRTVVWTVGADNKTPHAGDAVKLTFTLKNTELFAISDAKVRMVSAAGIAATCDIADGEVAAGAVVTCTALYETTAADAVAGEVAFEVELTGYLPLGPGNPRANAVTRTLFSVADTIVVPIAAASAPPADSGDEATLAQTGLEAGGLGALAAAMILAGGGVLIVRRRFGAQTV